MMKNIFRINLQPPLCQTKLWISLKIGKINTGYLLVQQTHSWVNRKSHRQCQEVLKARRFVFVPIIFRFISDRGQGVGSIVQAVGCEDRGGSGRHYARGCYILHLPSPQKRKESTVDRRRNTYSHLEKYLASIWKIFGRLFATGCSSFLIIICALQACSPNIQSCGLDQIHLLTPHQLQSVLLKEDVCSKSDGMVQLHSENKIFGLQGKNSFQNYSTIFPKRFPFVMPNVDFENVEFKNPNFDPEMFDLSLRPICGVQYGGNLHNVPQQGAFPSFLTRDKSTIHSLPPGKSSKSLISNRYVFNIQKIFSTCSNVFSAKYITWSRNPLHIVSRNLQFVQY